MDGWCHAWGDPLQEEEPQTNPYDVGYAGDGRILKAGASIGNGIFEESLENKAEKQGLLAEGLVPIPQIPELSPAQRAARRMEKLIHDQIAFHLE